MKGNNFIPSAYYSEMEMYFHSENNTYKGFYLIFSDVDFDRMSSSNSYSSGGMGDSKYSG